MRITSVPVFVKILDAGNRLACGSSAKHRGTGLPVPLRVERIASG
jgi:hypothetical protein